MFSISVLQLPHMERLVGSDQVTRRTPLHWKEQYLFIGPLKWSFTVIMEFYLESKI